MKVQSGSGAVGAGAGVWPSAAKGISAANAKAASGFGERIVATMEVLLGDWEWGTQRTVVPTSSEHFVCQAMNMI